MAENYPDYEPPEDDEEENTELNLEQLVETGTEAIPEESAVPVKELSIYEQINNDYVRITFMTVAIMSSIFTLVSCWLTYEAVTYFFLMTY